ncbi:MAG: hypothetical protein U9O55_03415 [Patescibacteria group bacterium]|nr:hypothetical protein [Patescibacteria group bacterium]
MTIKLNCITIKSMLNKQILLPLLLVIVIIGVFILIPKVFRIHVVTDKINISSIIISDDVINLKIDFGGNSGAMFSGYKTEYRNSTLYINVYWTYLRVLMKGYGDISIPNTYDNIDAIYFQGSNSEDKRLIWSETDQK